MNNREKSDALTYSLSTNRDETRRTINEYGDPYGIMPRWASTGARGDEYSFAMWAADTLPWLGGFTQQPKLVQLIDAAYVRRHGPRSSATLWNPTGRESWMYHDWLFPDRGGPSNTAGAGTIGTTINLVQAGMAASDRRAAMRGCMKTWIDACNNRTQCIAEVDGTRYNGSYPPADSSGNVECKVSRYWPDFMYEDMCSGYNKQCENFRPRRRCFR